MLEPEDRGGAADADLIGRLERWASAGWRRLNASNVGANLTAIAEAILYLAAIALIVWLWATPEADFRYWGF